MGNALDEVIGNAGEAMGLRLETVIGGGEVAPGVKVIRDHYAAPEYAG